MRVRGDLWGRGSTEPVQRPWGKSCETWHSWGTDSKRIRTTGVEWDRDVGIVGHRTCRLPSPLSCLCFLSPQIPAIPASSESLSYVEILKWLCLLPVFCVLDIEIWRFTCHSQSCFLSIFFSKLLDTSHNVLFSMLFLPFSMATTFTIMNVYFYF